MADDLLKECYKSTNGSVCVLVSTTSDVVSLSYFSNIERFRISCRKTKTMLSYRNGNTQQRRIL